MFFFGAVISTVTQKHAGRSILGRPWCPAASPATLSATFPLLSLDHPIDALVLKPSPVSIGLSSSSEISTAAREHGEEPLLSLFPPSAERLPRQNLSVFAGWRKDLPSRVLPMRFPFLSCVSLSAYKDTPLSLSLRLPAFFFLSFLRVRSCRYTSGAPPPSCETPQADASIRKRSARRSVGRQEESSMKLSDFACVREGQRR